MPRPQPGQPTRTWPGGGTAVGGLTPDGGTGGGEAVLDLGGPGAAVAWAGAGAGITSRWPQRGQETLCPAPCAEAFSTLRQAGQENLIIGGILDSVISPVGLLAWLRLPKGPPTLRRRVNDSGRRSPTPP